MKVGLQSPYPVYVFHNKSDLDGGGGVGGGADSNKKNWRTVTAMEEGGTRVKDVFYEVVLEVVRVKRNIRGG